MASDLNDVPEVLKPLAGFLNISRIPNSPDTYTLTHPYAQGCYKDWEELTVQYITDNSFIIDNDATKLFVDKDMMYAHLERMTNTMIESILESFIEGYTERSRRRKTYIKCKVLRVLNVVALADMLTARIQIDKYEKSLLFDKCIESKIIYLGFTKNKTYVASTPSKHETSSLQNYATCDKLSNLYETVDLFLTLKGKNNE